MPMLANERSAAGANWSTYSPAAKSKRKQAMGVATPGTQSFQSTVFGSGLAVAVI